MCLYGRQGLMKPGTWSSVTHSVDDLVSQLLMVASPTGAHSPPAVWLVAVASKYEHEPVLTLLASGRERTVLEQERSPWLAMKDHASDTSNARHKTTVGKSFISKEASNQLFWTLKPRWRVTETLEWNSAACFLKAENYTYMMKSLDLKNSQLK